MDKLLVHEFRTRFRELDEPTEVVRYGRTVGTYYPAGTIPVYIEELPETDPRIVELAAEVERLKGLLAYDHVADVAPIGPVVGTWSYPNMNPSVANNVFEPLRAVRADARKATPVPKPGSRK